MAKEQNKEKNDKINIQNEINNININQEFIENNTNNENNIIIIDNSIENKNNKKNRNINSEFKDMNLIKKINNFQTSYNTKELNEKKNINKIMSKTMNNFNYNYNPGKELYERGMKYKENEKEKLEILKRNLEIEDIENNTFTPKINKISQIQNSKRKEKGLECSNPEVIKNYMQYKKFKLEYLKQKTNKDFNKILIIMIIIMKKIKYLDLINCITID